MFRKWSLLLNMDFARKFPQQKMKFIKLNSNNTANCISKNKGKRFATSNGHGSIIIEGNRFD